MLFLPVTVQPWAGCQQQRSCSAIRTAPVLTDAAALRVPARPRVPGLIQLLLQSLEMRGVTEGTPPQGDTGTSTTHLRA